MIRPFATFATALVLTLPGAVSAQETSIGEREYMNSCAQCHGPEGKGDGFLVEYFDEIAAPDLTGLQKANDGVFPVSEVYAIIDGTEASGVHGDRAMPAWGYRYATEAEEQLGWDFALPPTQRDSIVRTRIFALIEHLATLQEE